MMNLSGKVGIVTGGGSGIGAAAATIMAECGAKMMCADLRLDAAQKTAEAINASGGEAEAILCDVEKEADIENMVSQTVKRFGRLDIMHNNAALVDYDIAEADTDILTVDSTSWDRLMAVNLRGVMLGCKYAIVEMKKTGGGAIVNTASTYGMRAYANWIGYGTSKAGIIQLTRMVATSHGRDNIRCNAVSPALTRTQFVNNYFSDDVLNMNIDASAVGELAGPRDLGYAVAFLASDAAKFITGHVLPVDGGVMAQLPTTPGGRELLKANAARR